MAANGLTDYMITVGQELLIPVEPPTPEAGPEVSGTPGAETAPPPRATSYVVQTGDSLSQIARRFDVTVQAIMDANGITNPDSIREGQELVIPGRASSTETPGIGGPPTPTIPSQFVYPAPTLLGPPDRWDFRGEQSESPILLNWLSVGLLGEDQWYSVSVRYVSAETEQEQAVAELTKANSYRVTLDQRPPVEVKERLFEWQVAVVQQVEAEPEGTLELVPIGHQSEIRTFYWH
jgi:LysM repeat protein